MTDYLEDIKEIINRQFGIEEANIEEDSLLESDLAIADLDMEDLVTALETKYEIQIQPESVAAFKKVSDIVTYLYENADNH